jgi:hypothetical protein
MMLAAGRGLIDTHDVGVLTAMSIPNDEEESQTW